MHRRARIGMDFADLPCNACLFLFKYGKEGSYVAFFSFSF
jgi:hypothetical protein